MFEYGQSPITCIVRWKQLNEAYHKAGKQYGMHVAEVGHAFLNYAATHDKDDLYHEDKSHPSEIGSAIAAKVIWDQVKK